MPSILEIRLTGGAANSNPNLSLGGAMSSVKMLIRKALNAAAVVDKGAGKVGFPITGHGYTAGQRIVVEGTVNYDDFYKVHSDTTANEIVVIATYVAETLTGDETVAMHMNSLYANATLDQTIAGAVHYRAIDIYNAGDDDAESIEFFMSTVTASENTHLEMGAGAVHDGSDQTDTIADEETAPEGISFAHYVTGSKLALPDIPVGQACRVWTKRVIAAGAGNHAHDVGVMSLIYA